MRTIFDEFDVAVTKAKALVRIKELKKTDDVFNFLRKEVGGFSDSWYMKITCDILGKPYKGI